MLEPLDASAVRRVGPYALIGRIGAGGMGTVHLARRDGPVDPSGPADPSRPSDREVLAAVKTVREDVRFDAEFRLRFRREVEAARAVRSPHTVALIDAAPDAEPPWLATEFVPGPSLAEAVRRHGPLPPDVVRALGADLARALRAVHGARLVHRDLKPANVLLAEAGPKVIDFGIARAFDGTVLTAAGSAVGTPGFMSPEQVGGTDPVGPASDVFGLGALLCWAATGNGPFDDAELAAVLTRIVEGRADLRHVPAGLRDLVASCLAVDPAARPTTDALVRALDPQAAGERPGALFARSQEPFPWPSGVRELIAAYEEETGRIVASAPRLPLPPPVPAAVPGAGQGPGRPDGAPASRRTRTRTRAAVIAASTALAVTATVLGVRLLAGDETKDDGAKTPGGSSSAPVRPAAPPDPEEPMMNGGAYGAMTLAYPEPGTPGAAAPKGWKPWHATASSGIGGCVLGTDLLLCGGSGGVEARRTTDGTLVWRHAAPVRPGGAVMTPGLSTDRVFLPEGEGVLVARRSDARPLARWPGAAGFLPELAVAAGGTVYIAYEGAAGVGLPGEMLFRAYRESDGQRIWERKLRLAYPNSMTPVAGRLHITGPGGTWQLDRRTGRVLAEERKVYCGDVVVPDGTSYCSDSGSARTVVRGPGTLDERGTVMGDNPLTAGADGTVITADGSGATQDLIASRAGDGTVLWRSPLGWAEFPQRGEALLVGRRLVLVSPAGIETRSLADGSTLDMVLPDGWPDREAGSEQQVLVSGDVVFYVRGTAMASARLP
ncbi:protein kinase [Streptomyces sp. NPDC002669]|uniref:serine/threonine-protein kinase n=1 Tax=Streptomyces sp. NPDC002669 TaxID=3364658 RepID=UPI003694E015